MRILVVDDEQIMLDSISLTLSGEPDLQVEIARTGREAIEKADAFRPELVLMDIKMPGINGLEALAEIRRMDSQAILVILTAYENFSYAQEAIRLNIYDYLVKPVNKARLLDLLGRVKQQLINIREARLEELALRERYKKLLPVIENEFMFELMNGINDVALAEYQELLAIKLVKGFFLAVSYRDKASAPVDSLIELSFTLRLKMSDLAEEIRNFIPCLVAPAKTYPLSIFIPMNQAGPESVDIEPVAVARKVLNLLQSKEILTDIHIGIGRIYSASSELKRSYQESLLALSYCGQSPVYHYDDLQVQQERNWESELSQEVQEIIEAVRFGNVAKVEMYSAQLVLKYANFQAEQDRICFYLLELLLSTYKICKDSTTGQTGSPGFEQIMAIFNNRTDLREILKEITQRIKALTGIVKEGRQNQVKSIIRQAKDFIDSQYTEQLSLEDISHTVGISPFYFSRLFREELGINFSEYVTKLRLEKAVLLLAQGLSVKECCFSVGYNDPNYFSRIFRKYYDITPSEYRDEQVQLKGRNSTC